MRKRHKDTLEQRKKLCLKCLDALTSKPTPWIRVCMIAGALNHVDGKTCPIAHVKKHKCPYALERLMLDQETPK